MLPKTTSRLLAVPPPNETQCLILVPWHDIQQLRPTLEEAAGEKSSLLEVVWVVGK